MYLKPFPSVVFLLSVPEPAFRTGVRSFCRVCFRNILNCSLRLCSINPAGLQLVRLSLFRFIPAAGFGRLLN